MVVIASVRYAYSSGTVGTTNWVQLNPVGGNGVSLSGGYLTGITPTGNVNGVPFFTNSPSSPPSGMPAECTEFDVFDSSGSTMQLGVGQTSGAVQMVTTIPPGGPAFPIKTGISKGSLIWIRAMDTQATGGEFLALFRHGRR